MAGKPKQDDDLEANVPEGEGEFVDGLSDVPGNFGEESHDVQDS